MFFLKIFALHIIIVDVLLIMIFFFFFFACDALKFPQFPGVPPDPHPCPTQDIIFHPFYPNCAGHLVPEPMQDSAYIVSYIVTSVSFDCFGTLGE